MRKLIYFEVASFVATLFSALAWLANPSGNWEQITFLSGFVVVAIEMIRRFRENQPAGRFESNGARVQHRERLRQQFVHEVHKCAAQGLRRDVIIRHVDRVDNYPETDLDKPGISSWFRVGLADTYNRGIVLGLRIGGLIDCEGGLRFRDYVNGEESDRTDYLMGNVPFDSIAEVNMDGDEYYYFPHIFCYFDHDGEPYERLWFAEKVETRHGLPHYRHVADYADVVANNIDDGTLDFA